MAATGWLAACDSEDSSGGEPDMGRMIGGAGGGQAGAGGGQAGAGGGQAGAGGGEAGAGGGMPVEVACNDGEDNDGDGLVDLEDPGCSSEGDPDEFDPPPPPACDDGLDNDLDGLTDFPNDPGCSSRQDETEENELQQPQCTDTLDNDSDGRIDLEDPGCTNPADMTEADPDERPACNDVIDNDGDGVIDFPAEPGCAAAGDDDEDDPASPPACGNGMDDDGDGFVDYPNDPGCAGVGDRDEADPSRPTECSDGRDNDVDGRVDYPDDEGCTSSGDTSERGSCGDFYDPPRLDDGETVTIDTSRGLFESQGTCGGNGSPELVVSYLLDHPVEALTITTDNPGTLVPTTIYVRLTNCLEPLAEIACVRENQNAVAIGNTLTIPDPPQGELLVYIDGVAGAGGPVELRVDETPLAQCLNGVDDDEDGLADYPNDPGCEQPSDRDETTPDPAPICGNGMDDDEDGLTDYPDDVGCFNAADSDETDVCGADVQVEQLFLPRNSNILTVSGTTLEEEGASNDFRGSCGGVNAPERVYYFENDVRYQSEIIIDTDHPETEISTVVYVRSECTSVASELQCDRGDSGMTERGRVSLRRLEPGGYFIYLDTRFGEGGNYTFTMEFTEVLPPCDDGDDNDRDGLIDFPNDPGCDSPEDADERDGAP
ncbi:MAG: hypothetical protein ACE366_11240 [Bradymonadia bacterium]